MLGHYDIYLIVFLTALLVSYLLTPLVRGIACRWGVVDLPNERRPHKHPTARGGGVAVVLGVYAACLLALALPWHTKPRGFDMSWWMGFLPSSLVLLAVGLWDDIRGLGAWKKLAGQIVAAFLVYISGTHFGKFFGFDLPPWLDGLMVVFWIVAVINAFNLIDGLDGLASGLAIISATGLCGILVLGNLSGVVLVLVALIGACLAFLRYNFHPATIFLGDTGSMFIGFTMGVVSLQTFTKNTFFLSMTIPLLVVGVPIYDALLAVWRRSVRRLVRGNDPTGAVLRKGIMTADVEHLHHRLLKSGFSTRRVAVILFIANTVLVAFGLLMTTFQSHAAGIFLLALIVVVYVLFRQMAVIELRETGKVLLTGLRRPAHSMAKALVYPCWDMICLTGALAIEMWFYEPASDGFWHSWFMELPIWVTPTFSLLALSRTYITVWTRARTLDVLMLLFTLQAGLLISLGLALIIEPFGFSKMLLRAVVFVALGHAGVLAARIFYRCMEEIVAYLKSKNEGNANNEKVLLYGAGGRSQMFLKERSLSNSDNFDNRIIVGMIDDEPTLHGKWVYGYSVLGGIGELSKIISHHQINTVIIVAQLRTETYLALQTVTVEHGIRLNEWRFEQREPEPVAGPLPLAGIDSLVNRASV